MNGELATEECRQYVGGGAGCYCTVIQKVGGGLEQYSQSVTDCMPLTTRTVAAPSGARAVSGVGQCIVPGLSLLRAARVAQLTRRDVASSKPVGAKRTLGSGGGGRCGAHVQHAVGTY
jgi:hypothetical protein